MQLTVTKQNNRAPASSTWARSSQSRLGCILFVVASIGIAISCRVVADETKIAKPAANNANRTMAAMRSADSPIVLIAAHRGGYSNDKQDKAPENSIENIDNCARRGYDLYETDIQRSKDGHFVIMHDATIDRETNGTGEVREMTLAEIGKLRKRYRDGSISESRVATLQEFLNAGKDRVVFKADLKPGVSEHFRELYELIKAQDALDGIVLRVHYRELATLRTLRERGFTWPRGLVMFRVNNRKQLDEVIEAFDPSIIHIDVKRDDPLNEARLKLIRYAKTKKLHVQVHAEGDEVAWRKLVDAGARMFHTNKPHLVQAFCESIK